MKKLIILSAVFLLINSCSDDTLMFDPTYFGDGFKGITFTGETDPTPFKADPTDWYYSISNYQSKGQNTSGINIDIEPLKGYMFAPAYPNPSYFDRGFHIRFAIPNEKYVSIYIVNKNYEVVTVLVNRELETGIYEYYIENKNLKAPAVYRVIMETDGFYSKGDVWIK
jgi:hypothetical protein